MRNFQGTVFIWTQTWIEIFKFALVYLEGTKFFVVAVVVVFFFCIFIAINADLNGATRFASILEAASALEAH